MKVKLISINSPTMNTFQEINKLAELVPIFKDCFLCRSYVIPFSLIFNAKCQFLIIFKVLTRTGYVSMNIP